LKIIRFDPICEKEAKTPRCSRVCQRSYNISYDNDKYFGKKAYSIDNDEKQIQTEIMLNGPVEATYMLYEDFLYYKEGIYQHIIGSELGNNNPSILFR
jgi:cathepsin B